MKKPLFIFLLMGWISISASIYENPCQEMIYSEDACVVELQEYRFSIFSNGSVNFETKKDKLNFYEGYGLDTLRDAVIDGENAFFCFDVGDGLYGLSTIFSFSLVTEKINWQSELKGFNGSPMLIVDGSIYVGAFGTVTKLNAKSGKVIWEHTGFYDDKTGAFNSFEKPTIENGMVIFTESRNQYAKYDGRKKIVISIATGKVISK